MPAGIVCNTSSHHSLRIAASARTISVMAQQKTTKNEFRELLREACRSHPSLWKSDGEHLSINAVAAYLTKKGYPINQPTLSRQYNGQLPLNEGTINAVYHVFGLPRALLRGEQGQEMERLLSEYRLSTLLVAQRLESLPRKKYDLLVQQINDAVEEEERIQRLMETANVTTITKAKRSV